MRKIARQAGPLQKLPYEISGLNAGRELHGLVAGIHEEADQFNYTRVILTDRFIRIK
jgi:hypothetical protein